MSDAVKNVRTALLADTGVSLLVGQHVFGGTLPEQYDPSSPSLPDSPETDGPAITLSVRGGLSHPEFSMQSPSVQLSAWAGVNQHVVARQVYDAAFALMMALQMADFGNDGRIVSVVPEDVGMDRVDLDNGWALVTGHFKVTVVGGQVAEYDGSVFDGNSLVGATLDGGTA